jgi:hypothetical protein
MITLTREEAQQVLDAVLDLVSNHTFWTKQAQYDKAIETLRARLAQPEPEPVAWMNILEDGYKCLTNNRIPGWTPLYVTPQPQRKPLTDTRHISYVCPQCAWTLDADDGLKVENAVLMGLLVDARAVIKTIEPDCSDEAEKLSDLLRAIHYAIEPYRHKGALL